MEENTKVYGDSMEEYIKMQTKIMNEQPEMAMFKDETADLTYILVRDTQENVEKFQNYLKKYNTDPVPDNVLIFYNEPYYYELAIDGFQARYKIKEEKERQEKINNPEVDLDINSKEELIEYLINEVISNEEILTHEFSTEDYEVDQAKIKAHEKELRILTNKYL